MRTLTDDEKAFCADVRARDAALRVWMESHKRNSYHPDELPPEINPPTNEERSRCECLEFESAAADPRPYFAYLSSDGKRVTTFTGDTLATLVHVGKTWRGPSGNKWTAFRAAGIDGRIWHGRHNGPGMYLRMRPSLQKQD
jgi:hypothetical protein